MLRYGGTEGRKLFIGAHLSSLQERRKVAGEIVLSVSHFYSLEVLNALNI